MRYLFYPKDRIFVKGYGFLSFAKNISKNIRKNISKNVNTARNFLIILNNMQQMHLKLI